MAPHGILHASLAVSAFAIAMLVAAGRRGLSATGVLDSDFEAHLMDVHELAAEVNGDSDGDNRNSQDQHISLVQHQNLSARMKRRYFFDLFGNDAAVCDEDQLGVALRCRLDCQCGWGQQCYPKFTKEGNVGICETAMPVLALLSFLLFASVLASFVALRTFLQWQSLEDVRSDPSYMNYKAPMPGSTDPLAAPRSQPAPGTSAVSDSDSSDDSDREEANEEAAPAAATDEPSAAVVAAEARAEDSAARAD